MFTVQVSKPRENLRRERGEREGEGRGKRGRERREGGGWRERDLM